MTLMVRRLIMLTPLLLLPLASSAEEHKGAEPGWDGLVEIESSNIAAAFIDPEADFSGFKRVEILQPYVAFRSNWLRDQNRSRTRNVRPSDVERIKSDIASIFVGVFTERLEAAGYEVVNYADEDVLVLRPAIIDLDVVAPDVRSPGRSRTYVADSGAATIFLELFDSVSGDLLGRGIDRRVARRGGGMAVNANRVTNRADARREMRAWADTLIEFLDQHYIKADAAKN